MTKSKQAKKLKRKKAKRKNANMQQNGLSYNKKQELEKNKKYSKIKPQKKYGANNEPK